MKQRKYYNYLLNKYIEERLANCENEETKMLIEIIIGNNRLQNEHLNQQDALLEIIKNQSKPQFLREVGANLTADFIFEGFLRLIKHIKI